MNREETIMKKKIMIIAGAIAVATVLGFGIYKSDASQAEPKLNYDEVENLISTQYPGTITEMELEKRNNRAIYEIEIVNDGMEYELKVDGNSGEIVKLNEKRIAAKQKENTQTETIDLEQEKQKAQENDDQEKSTKETKVEKKQTTSTEKKNKKTVLDAKEAIAIAQKEFPGTVTDVELDEDDGRLIYEIEIKANGEEADFDIDAMTGEIIVIEIDED